MKYSIQKETLESIADAIRDKNETTAKLSPSEMAAAIEAIQTGVEPVGTYTTGIADENILAGEFVKSDYYSYYDNSSGVTGSPIRFGIDANGNEIFIFIKDKYGTSSGAVAQTFDVVKREGNTYTLLKTTQNVLHSDKTTSWLYSSIRDVIRIGNTNKIMVFINDWESSGNHFYYLSAWIGEINLSTYAITAVGTYKFCPNGSYGYGTKNDTPGNGCYWDEANNRIICMFNTTSSGSSEWTSRIVSVITFNEDYTTFDWVGTTLPSSKYSIGSNTLVPYDIDNQIYAIVGRISGVYSSSYRYVGLTFIKVNDDNTVSTVQDATILKDDSYFDGYGTISNILKLSENKYIIFGCYYSGSFSYSYRGRYIVFQINSDYTITILKDAEFPSYTYPTVPFTTTSPVTSIQIYGAMHAFKLENDKIMLLANFGGKDYGYGYYHPQRIIFSFDDETNAITLDSLKFDYSLLTSAGTFKYENVFAYFEELEDNKFVVNGLGHGMTTYTVAKFLKATSGIKGIAYTGGNTGDEMIACLIN